jgi:predicted ATPase/DNA-binding SARP family transcriptional activator
VGLQVNVLGLVSASFDGRALPLGGPRQQAVLAALVVARPEVLSTERLIIELWGEDPDISPNGVQYHISRLRSVLEPHRAAGAAPQVLLRSGPGYRLRLDPSSVDADVFSELCIRGQQQLSAGDAEGAALALEQALGLWQGRPYSGIGDFPFLLPEISRLTELALAAAEDRLRAWSALHRTGEVIAAARVHTAEHPWREAGWALLASALAAEGRQADALAALRTVRRILADELGLDPGAELVAVEKAVLAQEVRPTTRAVATRPSGPPALPVPVTELVGREALRSFAVQELKVSRLLTLTGPGGVGKTRLALEVAREHADRVALVELAAYDPGHDLVPALAGSLGAAAVRDLGGLVGWLGDRQVLLVLDNAEHLVEEVAELVRGLQAAPGVRILLTSREVLDVPGEVVLEVPPLDEDSAVALFLARAVAAQPGRDDVRNDEEQVRRICRELDRLPLALELAAARLRLLSLGELADGLERRFELLGDGHRGAPRHQQGLLSMVSWSVSAASEGERELLGQLSVFPDTFDLDAVQAVVRSDSDGDTWPGRAAVLSRLAGLVRRSLVAAVPDTAPRRYRLLITIREYARDQLTPERLQRLRHAHLQQVRARTRSLSRRLYGAGAPAALDALQREAADHRSAIAAAMDLGASDALLELVADLGWFWYRRAFLSDGIRWLRAALEHGAAAAPTEQGPAWLALGRLLYLSGDAVGARVAFDRAKQAAAVAQLTALEARATVWRAHVLTFLDGPEAGMAQAMAGEALAARTETAVLAEATMVLGMAQRLAGHDQLARTTLRRAVDVATGAGYTWAAVSSAWALMKASRDAGDVDHALAAAADMVEPLAREGDVSSWLVLLHTTAAVLAEAGLTAEAAELHAVLQRRAADTGFDPEQMDPVDGPKEAAAIRSAVGSVSAQGPLQRPPPRPIVELLARLGGDRQS